MKSYKVITMKDKWLSGKFDPAVLEATLNSYAKQGWRVVQSVTAMVPGLLNSQREELVVILERDEGGMPAQSKPSGGTGGTDVYKL